MSTNVRHLPNRYSFDTQRHHIVWASLSIVTERVSSIVKAATWLLILLGPALPGQSLGDHPVHPVFEVASIKPAAPLNFKDSIRFIGCMRGPGWPDPGTITCRRAAIGTLVSIAYGISPVRISGKSVTAPGLPQFDILAKVPAGTTKEQAEQMWQSLLVERFKLEAHYETKEMPVYGSRRWQGRSQTKRGSRRSRRKEYE